MSIIVKNDKGWTEAVIDNDCDYDKFYRAAEILRKDFQIEFSLQLNDFDTFYWDFNYKGSQLTLHYNNYFGLSIFPKAFKLASSADNEKVIEIGQMLFDKLSNRI